MKDTEYANAVARIRANESNLLNSVQAELLISADTYQSVINILEEFGWIEPENHDDINMALKLQGQKTWKLLCEIAPDIRELEFLIIKNDFHNIKAALKAFVSMQTLGSSLNDTVAFVIPSSIEPEQIKDAIYNKKFDNLPDYAREAAEKTYEVLIRTGDGQIADIMLDAMALSYIVEIAEKTKNKFIINMAEIMCVTANLKTALRSARTGKDRQFLDTALFSTKTLDKNSLIEAAVQGDDVLIRYISTTNYFEAADHIRKSTTSFEKWCDDILMDYVKNAKYICLGVEPLIAYYIAKDAEIKNVRIILSCKYNKLSPEIIKERVRNLYV